MENELEVVNIRLVKEPSLYSEQTLDSPQAVVELMAKELSQYDREVFCILNMKNNGQVINMNLVSVGTINASLVIPREVFKSSILANASAIIGLHNHPSGNVKPSKEDMIVTRKLQKCGQLLGIELLNATIGGKPVVDDQLYTVATIDYLADGNGRMDAFLQAEKRECPEDATLRGLFLDYVRKQTAEGKIITSKLDGRITVK